MAESEIIKFILIGVVSGGSIVFMAIIFTCSVYKNQFKMYKDLWIARVEAYDYLFKAYNNLYGEYKKQQKKYTNLDIKNAELLEKLKVKS